MSFIAPDAEDGTEEIFCSSGGTIGMIVQEARRSVQASGVKRRMIIETIVRKSVSLPIRFALLYNAMTAKRVFILGVPIDPLTREQVVDRLRAYLAGDVQRHVMTPNSEMLVEAHRNPAFRALLNRADLTMADGMGLLWVARMLGMRLPERVTGVDTVTDLCARLTEDCPVFLLGAGEGVAERAAAALVRRNPRLRIAGTFAGSPRPGDAAAIVRRINDVHPRLLLVAYGAPRQDEWIDRHLADCPSVRVAMGVGGTFDFLAGVQARAPAALRRLGLEWAWRLVREPKRLPRILRATVVFPFLALTAPRAASR